MSLLDLGRCLGAGVSGAFRLLARLALGRPGRREQMRERLVNQRRQLADELGLVHDIDDPCKAKA